MALSAEERAQLVGQIPHFDAQPKYAFLADKKLLPQQRGLESFEDPPFLTQLRRAMFGHTQKEQNLIKQQDAALIPFNQEQEIQGKLRAAHSFMQEIAPTMEQALPFMPSLAKMATPDQKVAPYAGSMQVPTDLVPNTFDIDELQKKMTIGSLQDPRGGAGIPLTSSLVPPMRSLDVFGQPEVNMQAKINPLQAQFLEDIRAGKLVDPTQALVPPSLQSSRETPVEVQPGNAIVSKQGQKIYQAAPADPKNTPAYQTVAAGLTAAGIPLDSKQAQDLFKALAEKTATHAPGTNVTTNVSTEKKYGEVFSTKVAEQDTAMMDAAQKAPDLAQRSNRILQVLGDGKAITGTGAEFRLQAAKAFKLAGLSAGDGIEETETLSADLASSTLDAIKASGLGGGTGFSNADREFLEKAKGGKITLEAGSLKRLAELAHRAAVKSAERWGERSKKIPKSALEGTGIDTKAIAVPPMYVGSDADWARLPKGTAFMGPDGKVRVK